MFKWAAGAMICMLVIAMFVAFGQGLYKSFHSPSHDDLVGSYSHNGPQESGQSAFGALSEIIGIIERKKFDWAQVDMDALWAHLQDMNSLMMYTSVEKHELPHGLVMNVTGGKNADRAMDAMIPTHSNFLEVVRPKWDISFQKIQGGYSIRVLSDDEYETAKIKALGFSGFMVQDDHHASHHLKISTGQSAHTHQ